MLSISETTATILHFFRSPHNQFFFLSSSSTNRTTSTTFSIAAAITSPESQRQDLNRRHNSLFLRLHNQPHGFNTNSVQQQQQLPRGDIDKDLLQREVANEMSISTKRAPRFPGSVVDVSSDGRKLLDGASRDWALKRALELRRGVAAETLRDSLRAGKLSITYSNNLVSVLGQFVDAVVIGAAAMKEDPEMVELSFNARAKRFIQGSGIVPLVKWLKHNSLTYPQIGKVICMCSGNLESVRHVAEWLKSIHVKGECLGLVLVKAGVILGRDLNNLEEMVGYLEQKGVRRDWIGFIVSRCPQVLALTMEELEARVKFYMDMGMSEKDFGTMVFDYPRVLGYFNLEELSSKVAYLQEFGLSKHDVGRLIAFKPQLMGCSIEERWKPLVRYLYHLGVQRDGMKRILLAKPMIFCVDLETTIAPKVHFLQEIGVQEEAIGGVLVKFPSFLTYSLYKKIQPVTVFLMTKAGVSKNDIGKVIALDPQLVGCSIVKKLDVNVRFFLSLGIRLQSLGQMIADFPMLLRYNLDILRPKYRYLRRTMVRPLQDLIDFPRFFSYSLEERIIPRHEIMVANQVSFKLRYMLAGTDADFNKRVEEAVQRRRRFESGKADVVISTSEAPTNIEH